MDAKMIFLRTCTAGVVLCLLSGCSRPIKDTIVIETLPVKSLDEVVAMQKTEQNVLLMALETEGETAAQDSAVGEVYEEPESRADMTEAGQSEPDGETGIETDAGIIDTETVSEKRMEPAATESMQAAETENAAEAPAEPAETVMQYQVAEVLPVSGCPSSEVYNELQECLSMLPQTYVEQFVSLGWTLQVLDYIPDRADNIVGLTDKNSKTITMVNNPIYAHFVVHEFGHFLEFTGVMDISDIDMFYEEAEKLRVWTGTSSANVSSVLEFMAESYSYYIFDHEGLRTYCPKVCEYFDNM